MRPFSARNSPYAYYCSNIHSHSYSPNYAQLFPFYCLSKIYCDTKHLHVMVTLWIKYHITALKMLQHSRGGSYVAGRQCQGGYTEASEGHEKWGKDFLHAHHKNFNAM